MSAAGTAVSGRGRGSIVSAVNWMSGLSLLLFWMPVFGPLIAGLVGGRKAGSVGRALVAVFVPAVLLAVLVGAGIGYLTRLAFWGVLAGLGWVALSFIHIGPLLLGAIVGGAAARLLPAEARG
jgi:hypothetical protein